MSRNLLWNALTVASLVLITTTTASAQVLIHGLDHTADGGASLSITPGGSLEVSGLLSLDNDALSVDVDGADGTAVHLQGLTEGVLRVEGRLDVSGTLDVHGGALDVRRQGSSLELYAVEPPTPGTYTIQVTVRDEFGNVTASPPQTGGGLLQTLSYGPTGIPDEAVVSYRRGRNPQTGAEIKMMSYTEDTNGSLPGGYRTAMVTLSSSSPVVTDGRPTRVRASGVTLTGGTPVTLTSDSNYMCWDGACSVQAVEPSPGVVRLDASPSGLTVTNDSGPFTGSEGVRLQLGDLNRDGISDIAVAAAVDHGKLTGVRVHSPFTIRKRIDKSTPMLAKSLVSGTSSTSGVVGEVSLYDASVDEDSNGDTTLSSDFSSLGSSSYEVRVLQGGSLVASATGTTVSQVLLDGAAPVLVVEEVSLNYEEIKWTYKKLSGSSSATLPGGAVVPLNPALSTEVVFEALGVSSSGLRVTSVSDLYTGGGSGGAVYLRVTGVPEPTSILLALFAAVGLVMMARRRSA